MAVIGAGWREWKPGERRISPNRKLSPGGFRVSESSTWRQGGKKERFGRAGEEWKQLVKTD